MAAPAYNTNLNDITRANNAPEDSTTTGWSALGGGGAGLNADPDFAYQGGFSLNKQITNTHKGQVFNYGSTIALGAHDHLFVWLYATTPGLMDTLANFGMTVAVGTATNAVVEFHVAGAAEYAAGGWVCWPIHYKNTANTSIPYRTLTGSPGADPQYFGGELSTTDTVRAVNFGVDVQRYGTGIFITSGSSGDPATFTGAAAKNDLVANRWGVLLGVPGGFAQQGRVVLGQNSGSIPDSSGTYFSDSNQLITFTDTPHARSDFTEIFIDVAATEFYLTSVTMLGLGQTNSGRLTYNDSGTLSVLKTCTFASIGPTSLQASVTASGSTWRDCGLITQNSAALENCTFDGVSGSTAYQLLSDHPRDITNCSFVSGGTGTGHGIRFTTPGTYTFTGNLFSGYGASGSTDAAVNNNSGGIVILNIEGQGDSPTVRNEAGSVTALVSTVPLTVTVKDTDGAVIENAAVGIFADPEGTEIMNKLTNVSGVASDSYNYGGDQDITLKVRLSTTGSTRYFPSNTSGTIDNGGFTATITLIEDQIVEP